MKVNSITLFNHKLWTPINKTELEKYYLELPVINMILSWLAKSQSDLEK